MWATKEIPAPIRGPHWPRLFKSRLTSDQVGPDLSPDPPNYNRKTIVGIDRCKQAASWDALEFKEGGWSERCPAEGLDKPAWFPNALT